MSLCNLNLNGKRKIKADDYSLRLLHGPRGKIRKGPLQKTPELYTMDCSLATELDKFPLISEALILIEQYVNK